MMDNYLGIQVQRDDARARILGAIIPG